MHGNMTTIGTATKWDATDSRIITDIALSHDPTQRPLQTA